MKPGRPVEADPERIMRVALRLFEKKGYDRVTMEQIAAAASVSRRTLFRHFPSKGDLVWHGLDDIFGEVRASAERLERRLGVAELIDQLFVPVLETLDDPAAEDLARRRLKLISTAPTLLNNPTLQQMEALIASTIAPRSLLRGTPAPLVARTLVAATFAALQWWAEHGEGRRALDTTLAALKAVARAMK